MAEREAADFADDTPKTSVKIGLHLRVDQRLSMMGTEDEMAQHIRRCMSHALTPIRPLGLEESIPRACALGFILTPLCGFCMRRCHPFSPAQLGPVQTAVLDCFGDVFGHEVRGVFPVGDGAGYL